MTKFLTELITTKTPVITLNKNNEELIEEKLNVIGLPSCLSDAYIKYMYKYNNSWYFYKKDENNGGYPFYMLDELMGTYLAESRNLSTVSYEIAKVEDTYGLASINFKQTEFEYYYISQLLERTLFKHDIKVLEELKCLAIDLKNEQQLLNHVFDFLALDIHMLQKDRSSTNLQMQINKKTNYVDLAPLYDYSNCSDKVGMSGINLYNMIVDLDELSIRSLLKKYPVFKEKLEFCLEQSMKEIWEQICIDYKFNQECSAYERVKDYYEIKDINQKQYIKSILNDIKKL